MKNFLFVAAMLSLLLMACKKTQPENKTTPIVTANPKVAVCDTGYYPLLNDTAYYIGTNRLVRYVLFTSDTIYLADTIRIIRTSDNTIAIVKDEHLELAYAEGDRPFYNVKNFAINDSGIYTFIVTTSKNDNHYTFFRFSGSDSLSFINSYDNACSNKSYEFIFGSKRAWLK